MMEFEFKQTQTDEASLKSYASLLSSVFPSTQKYTYEFLKWQYFSNPLGKVVGYDAFYDKKLVGHYVTIPVVYTINNTNYKGLLSLNTATDANFQGKGLFTQLATKTYELGAQLGYQFVIGVANQNSTHGFTKKLGFNLIAPLNAYLYLYDNTTYQINTNVFSSLIDEQTLVWRTNNPSTNYIQSNFIYSNTEKYFISACLSKRFAIGSNKSVGLIKMVIGLNNVPVTFFKCKIPDKLKPSPLNLIFKPLGDFNIDINTKNIYFELIDFDAY